MEENASSGGAHDDFRAASVEDEELCGLGEEARGDSRPGPFIEAKAGRRSASFDEGAVNLHMMTGFPGFILNDLHNTVESKHGDYYTENRCKWGNSLVHPMEKCIEALVEALPLIEDRLGYQFQEKAILIESFVHRSFLNESSVPGLVANERLEFLGDAVLNLYVSMFLFSRLPAYGEGVLSKQKAQAVCQSSCAVMMEKLDLIRHLLVGTGERTLFTRSRPSIVSDLFEAIVGAIYVDGGWHAAERFLSSHFDSHFTHMSETLPVNDKAALQELLAKQGRGLPLYNLEETSGLPHDRLFVVTVLVEGKELGRATGKTKREAEQGAAAQALALLREAP